MMRTSVVMLAMLMCGCKREPSRVVLTEPCRVGEILTSVGGTYLCVKSDPWKPFAQEPR